MQAHEKELTEQRLDAVEGSSTMAVVPLLLISILLLLSPLLYDLLGWLLRYLG
ncbi:MAG: hypothetical protein HYY30_13655 [Chloroflexi bacterium]|nr:hypothetical protein [Chloroflexota bacterium]